MDECVRDYEIRQGGMVVAAVSGLEETAFPEAIYYFNQYLIDATEDEPIELFMVLRIMTSDQIER